MGSRGAILGVLLFGCSSVAFLAREKFPPGARRAALLLPLSVAILSSLPSLVDPMSDPLSVMPTVGIGSFAAFKIAALAMGRGCLARERLPKDAPEFWAFVAACCMPVIPETAFAASKASRHTCADSRRNAPPDQLRSLASRFVCGLLGAAAAHAPGLPRLAVSWLYIYTLNMFLGLLTDVFALFTTASLGMRLAPCFDRPYLSASFTEFWSQRWNVTTTFLFRVLVYDPIVEGRLLAAPAPPSQQQQQQGRPDPAAASAPVPGGRAALRGARAALLARRFAGMQATFAVSAAWHLYLFWLLTGSLGGRWCLFFVAQAPIVLAEALARPALARLARRLGAPPLPRPLAVAATNLALIALADPLLVAPLVESGVVAGMFGQAVGYKDAAARALGLRGSTGAGVGAAAAAAL